MKVSLDRKEIDKALIDYVNSLGITVNKCDIRGAYGSMEADLTFVEPEPEKVEA